MSGTLYVVGTPIGNLSDWSPRAVDTLGTVDFIAAEDTRVTLKLLNHFGIKKEMVSYYEHNRRERGEIITARIAAGEDCAIVTDAGMPAISDPGQDLVHLCHLQGIPVVSVPGPVALPQRWRCPVWRAGALPLRAFCPSIKNPAGTTWRSLRTRSAL